MNRIKLNKNQFSMNYLDHRVQKNKTHFNLEYVYMYIFISLFRQLLVNRISKINEDQ